MPFEDEEVKFKSLSNSFRETEVASLLLCIG